MAEFTMPALGADTEAGTLVNWRVKPGDAVKRGDIVAEVETQKGIIEVEIFQTGVVEQVLVAEGAKVPVGTPLAFIHAEHEKEVTAPMAPPPPVALVTSAAALPPAPEAVAGAPLTHVRASPLAKRIAAELKVDLARVKGAGPGGAIQREDVERAAAEAARAQASILSRAALRVATGRAMAQSKREIPHYYLGTEIDMQRALSWLEAVNRARPVTRRLLSVALVIKAVARAVHTIPEMNGFWIDDTFRPSEAFHVGVGIALRPTGLVAPAIHDADTLSLDDLMAGLQDLITRARSGVLRRSERSALTITVTNLGEQGVSTIFGVIYPPQVALVGFGTINQRPWAVDGLLGVRPIMAASLAADHRASDGHRGGKFLAAINALLQAPEKL